MVVVEVLDEKGDLKANRLSRPSELNCLEASLERTSSRDREVDGKVTIGAHDEGVDKKPVARRRRAMDEVGRMLNSKSKGRERAKKVLGLLGMVGAKNLD